MALRLVRALRLGDGAALGEGALLGGVRGPAILAAKGTGASRTASGAPAVAEAATPAATHVVPIEES